MLTIEPMDTNNTALMSNVHPPDWVNPEPRGRYNLVVIGAGTAGLVSAAIAAGLGARVALIERHLLGGDCLNVGCVPSKAMIRSAHAAFDCATAGEFGVQLPGAPAPDFPAVMERLRRLRSGISPHDSAARFASLGVDVFFGEARFTGRDRLNVDGKTLLFKKAIIATGARAAVPPTPGLAEAGFLTNETVFTLTERPAELVVIGGGPIGCELAQAFARLGSRVTIVQSAAQFLAREDPDAAALLARTFAADGIRVLLRTNVIRVELRDGRKQVVVRIGEREESIPADQILVGVGRAPNVEGLDLEEAGVAFDPREGVHVDDHLRTATPAIFAAGDICTKYKFTHIADFCGRIAVQNALFPFLPKKRLSDLVVPWCTYTDPEIAHTGAYARELNEQGISCDTITIPFSEVDRAVLDGETEGFLKVHAAAKNGRILGATLVARHAGEMISELTLAMVNKLSLGHLGSVIHPYPTQAEAFRKAGDEYNRRRLTPGRKKFLEWLLSRMR